MKKTNHSNIFVENKGEETNACHSINYKRLKHNVFFTKFVC